MKTHGTDVKGQLFEMHTLKCGEQIWMYSDTLHKMYHLSDVYGYNLEKRSDFEAVRQLAKLNER